MTSKELMYVEDALGHEQFFQTRCSEAASMLSDRQLQCLAQEMCERHKAVFATIYDLL